MMKISIGELKEIVTRYNLQPCRVKGTQIVNIRKSPSGRFEDIDWDTFERILRSRGLAVYKAQDSDFLKIMKDR